MTTYTIYPLPPEQAVGIDELIPMYPVLRQSLLAKVDMCALSALFELRHAQGWDTHPQARGTIFHAFAAECLRTMRQQGEGSIPVSEALEILYEQVRQAHVPIAERVRVPLYQMPELRMAAIKFAKDNRFTVDRIIDIEKPLTAEITYDSEQGTVRRMLKGTIDVLLAEPNDGAVVIDWKDSWGLPPKNNQSEEQDEDGQYVSYEGYFQQRFYGWLVMKNYPSVQHVTLREFYPRFTQVREATLHRADLEHTERELSILTEYFDALAMAGTPKRIKDAAEIWAPSPGKHCGYCAKPGACPIEKEAKGEGAITTARQASQYAAEAEVADRVRKHRLAACKVWVETHGPIPMKNAKGRRVLGWVWKRYRKDGTKMTTPTRNFTTFTPEESDMGAKADEQALMEAMTASTEEMKAAKQAARA